MELTDHVDFTYTAGMDEAEVEAHLEAAETGVLALTDGGGAAYAIPLAYHYDGDTLLFRLSREDHSRKLEYIDVTDSACFVIYEFEPPDTSWSVLVQGELRRLVAGELSPEVVNERFPSLRIFDEEVDEVELVFVEMTPEVVTGRASVP